MKDKVGTYVLIAGILFFGAYALILSQNLINEGPDLEDHHEEIFRPVKNLEESNGIITNIWLHEESRLERFVENDIKYLFVDVGDIDSEGKLVTPDSEIESFLLFIENFENEQGYEFIVLPYHEIIIQGNYDLNSEEFRNNVVEDYRHLMLLGFDGSHIDIEAIPFDQRESYLDLLETLGDVSENKLLTVYSGGLTENPNVWSWDSDFYKEVSNRVDLISMPAYDFSFTSKEDYQAYLRESLREINTNEFNSKFMLTVPTHKSSPETLANSLQIFYPEVKQSSQNKFIGVSVFAEWTMDETEWKTFESFVTQFHEQF